MASVAPAVARCGTLVRAVSVDSDANVTLISALSLIPTLFGLGFSIDYARAQMLQSRINAVADAAALTATDQLYITQSTTVAKAAATQIFTKQVGDYKDFSFDATNGLAIDVTDSGTVYNGRPARGGWFGQSLNMFSGILNMPSLAISGTATANAAQPPNINFYVMLDNSPSMLLPTTSTGITQLESVNGNCAFSCHINQYVYNPMKDSNGYWIFLDQTYYNNGITGTAGVYRYDPTTKKIYDGTGTLLGSNSNAGSIGGSGGTLTYKDSGGNTVSVSVYYADPFWLSENYGLAYGSPASIPLRIDAELAAAQSLISTAQNTVSTLSSESINVTYKMQYYTFNYDIYPLTSTMTDVNSMTSSMLVPSSGTIAPYMLSNGYYPVNSDPYTAPGNYTNNSDSSPYKSLQTMNSTMATPGTGLNGNAPQEILFIVTDGYQDEMISGSQIRQQWNAQSLAQCTAIKARGIKIAILYTTYDPNTVLPDYPSYAAKTPSIMPALQSCSSPNPGGGYLTYQVSVNGDISAALAALFQLAVASSRLVQ